jgi:hypothetical protein
MNIQLVGVADIDKLWPRVAGDITRCLRKAPMEITAGDIWTHCRSGQWLLIIAHDGADVWGTTVWRFTANGYFECVCMGGNRLKDWFPGLIDTATFIAKAHDCRGLVATGRPEFSAFFKRHFPQARPERITFLSEFDKWAE